MRAKIEKKDLLSSIGHTLGIVDKKPAIPVLSHILIDFSKDLISIRGTDLDHSIIENVKADVETFGKITVPAQSFYDVIKKAPDGIIDLSLIDQGKKLLIVFGKSRFELSTLPAADFPEIHKPKNPITFTITTSDLKYLIDKTKFSMSTDETRHTLNGIYFHSIENVIKAATTDGHRLSVSSVQMNSDINFASGGIFSKKTVLELRKLLESSSEIVQVSIGSNQVQFSIDQICLIARLVDGKFPDYSRVIPDIANDFFVIDRKKFIETIDRVSVLADEKSKSVKFELNDSTLCISAMNFSYGSAKEEIEVENTLQNWSAGFNFRYLLDIAESLSGDFVKIYIKDSLSSILIVDKENDAAIFVVMPMRI